MILLFPKYLKRMLLICAAYIALVAVLLALNPGRGLVLTLIIAAFGLVLVVISQLLNAVNMHSRLLSKLYGELDAEGFLREYEPKLQLKLRNQNMRLMVRLHISNAYCALGRFDDAIALLASITLEKTGKPEEDMLSRFAIVSNLCYCAEQKGDLEAAQRYLDELLALKAQLEPLQSSKPENKRMVFNTELNELCMQYLKTGSADVKAFKALAQSNSQQLHRVTISLWIARCYLAQNNRREAEKLLRQIVKLAPNLYPGQEAQSLLSALPARDEADA
ncbi:MAG: tetratricopeptide repeat protein [Candidatus Ventricola sp.]